MAGYSLKLYLLLSRLLTHFALNSMYISILFLNQLKLFYWWLVFALIALFHCTVLINYTSLDCYRSDISTSNSELCQNIQVLKFLGKALNCMSVMSFLFWEEWEGVLLNVSVLDWEKKREVLHSKFTAVACLVKGQFVRDRENRVKFVVLQDGTMRLVVSIKEGQIFVPRKCG